MCTCSEDPRERQIGVLAINQLINVKVCSTVSLDA